MLSKGALWLLAPESEALAVFGNCLLVTYVFLLFYAVAPQSGISQASKLIRDKPSVINIPPAMVEKMDIVAAQEIVKNKDRNHS